MLKIKKHGGKFIWFYKQLISQNKYSFNAFIPQITISFLRKDNETRAKEN